MTEKRKRGTTGDERKGGMPPGPALRLGISSCLLGEEVRWNGGHKLDRYLVNTLGRFVEWVPVCPEVEIGMGTPRENIRLVGTPKAPRLVSPKSGNDYTETMRSWAEKRLDDLVSLDLHGYVLKKDSPSCGLERVRVYRESGNPVRDGRGLYASALIARMPLLPVEEEGRLHDMRLRENFVERIFAYQRWKQFAQGEPSPGGLVRFHTAHKLTLMAHSPKHYQAMGRMVAKAGKEPMDALLPAYAEKFMDGLGSLAMPGRHANVLMHIMGFLKDALGAMEKTELLGLIEDLRLGYVPLIVPLTLLRHHIGRHDVPAWPAP